MDEHAGPACALSGLIVGVFAVLLHDTTPPPSVATSRAADVSPARPRDRASTTPEVPPATRPSPPAEIVADPAGVPPPIRVEPPAPAQSPAPRPEPRPVHPPAPAEAPKPSKPPMPRPSFTIVGPGESLADVAARVYGSKDAAEALWKANRDQVERLDATVAQGTLLRVP